MGYSTDFVGNFDLDKQLSLDDFNYIKDFETTDFLEDKGESLSYDLSHSYFQWVPTKDGRGIEWDGGEKFYYYVDWLQYLIDYILTPRGYKLTGSVAYQGEEVGDCGVLVIEDEKVTRKKYSPADHDVKTLVKKGLEAEECNARWYLEEIAKKLGIDD